MALFPLYRYLDTVGDGSGIKNANGDYSATPQTFKIICPPGKGYRLGTFLVHLQGNTSFPLNGYANIPGGLINGWTMQLFTNGVVTQMLDGEPIKTNSSLERLSPAISRPAFSGAGDALAAPISIGQFELPLYIDPGDYLQITLNDDFTGLTSQHFIVQGFSI